MKERRVCEVSDGNCTAPAGIGISGGGWADGSGSCRATCDHCGLPCCAKCSSRRRDRRGKRRRICNTCLESR